ncbi:MAG: sensor histidine kinase, partial [Chloroflexota bacterium]|nr:sensor histidine kinase [Chloroflexota bacterium]
MRLDGEGALLQVTDHGIGLPPGAAATIFEPFERATNAAIRQLPGLGLGCVFKGVVTLGDEPRPRTDRRAVGGAGTAPAAAAGRDRAT